MATNMTNAPSYARAAVANAAKQVPKSNTNVITNFTGTKLTPGPGLVNSALGAIDRTIQNDMSNIYSGYAAGAAYANAASAQAQQNQYYMNKELMNLQNEQQEKLLQAQMDFSTQSAERANAFTESMWNKSAEYNAAQAQIQREWDEKMASTAYQRTMSDMKAAGLNPILAYMQGASSFGTGASASIGSTGSAMASTPGASAASGSVGNYSGQGFQVNDTLAIIGGIAGIVSDLINSARNQESLYNFDKKNNAFWDMLAEGKQDAKKVKSGEISPEQYEYIHGNAKAFTPSTLFRQWLHYMKNN